MRATCFISPSDTLKASLNALTSSLVMTPSALAIFALRAITPTVKGTSLSADRSRSSRSTSVPPPNSVPIEGPTDDCATADASRSQMDIEILRGLQLYLFHEQRCATVDLSRTKNKENCCGRVVQVHAATGTVLAGPALERAKHI